MPFFAVNAQMFLAGQVLCRIPWGIFQALARTYAADIMPVALRAYILSSANMCWLIGQICPAGVLRSQVGKDSEWAYRLPLALQWALAIPITIGIYFAPESPGKMLPDQLDYSSPNLMSSLGWRIRKERLGEARSALSRLTKANKDGWDIEEIVAMMIHTNETEKYLGSANITYMDCFSGINLRRTEIACMIWITQQVGN